VSAPTTPRATASRYRWAVLAAGTFAQTGYASLLFGVAVLAPELRVRFDLGLTGVGLMLAATSLGSIGTLYPWGRAADRFGERAVLASGLAAASLCVAVSAFVSSFAVFVTLLFLAGGFGASVNSASGRAVMHWFDARDRGFALGLRQTAVPIAGAWVALVLPAISSGEDTRPALLTLAAVNLAGAVTGLVVLRERPASRAQEAPTADTEPLRDRRIWLISAGSALLLEPQICLVGFLVVFLHAERAMSTAAAGAVLAVLNIFGIGTRIGAGRWSDLMQSRLRPLRRIAVASALLVLCCTVLLSAPLELLIPALVLMGCVTISWNGLSFAAVAETAGYGRSGTALGMQQTALAIAGSLFPIAFGAFVGGTSWRAGFAVSALFPLAGWRLLRSLPG
jgi:sugar phosphate permease